MAQNILDHMMNGSEQGRQLLEVLSEIADEEQASIFFLPRWIDGIQINKSYSSKSLGFMLEELFENTELDAVLMYPKVLVLIKDPQKIFREEKH